MPNRYLLTPTSQFFFCGLPLRMDASTKCSLGCQYCFASLRKGFRCHNNHLMDPRYLETKLYNTIGSGIVNELLNQSMPIHFGGMSDPFTTAKTTDITARLLAILDQAKYPVVISTKKPHEFLNLEWQNQDYVCFQVSFSVYNPKIAKILEPNAPSPQDRIDAIAALSQMGFKVTARLQPYIPKFHGDIINELLPRLFKAGIDHVILEHLKIPVERTSQQELSNALNSIGFSIGEYLMNGSVRNGREIELPQVVKSNYIFEIKSLCLYNTVSFGAGDHGFYHMSSTDCCCGIDKHLHFNHWFKGNFTNIIKSANRYIHINELDKFTYPKASMKMYVNSHSRLADDENTIKSLLMSKWNMPGTANAPDSYYGVKALKEKDAAGNTVYEIFEY